MTERFNPELELTTTQAADLLGVHPSTVKRACNDGELGFDLTSGGHRRIHLGALVEYAREREIATVLSPFHPFEAHVWTALRDVEESGSFDRVLSLAMGWVHRGHLERLSHLFMALARLPAVGHARFCDAAIGGLMERVGEAWQEGRLRAGEEHLVSQVMLEVLLRIRTDRREVQEREGLARVGTAVVGTADGNQHHLGSLCIRLLLEDRGWQVLYLGPDVPMEDFGLIQRGREAELVCISLRPPATAGDVARAVGLLGDIYDASRPYALAIGGTVSGLEPEHLEGPFRNAGVFSTVTAFEDALEAGWVTGAPSGVAP